MTIPEYRLLMEAAALKRVDMDYRNHLQAFLNFSVQARKGKQQKPVYRKFSQFFNYEEAQEKAQKRHREQRKNKFPGLGKFFKKGV